MNVKHRQVRFAVMLAMFSALGPFTVDMYLASFPQIMKSFGTNASMIQASLTTGMLGLSLGQIITGALSDVHGRRKPLLIAMFLYFISSLGCAFSPNIRTFIVLRFIEGFVASAGLVISRAIVRDQYTGVELTKFYSLLTMISSVSPLVSPLAGGAVISFVPWIGVFIFLAIFGVFLTTLTKWGIKETLPEERRVSSNFMGLLKNYYTLIRNRTFMGYALVSGLFMAGVFAYVSGSSFIYQKIYGVSPQLFSVLFALNGIGLMLSSQFVKKLAGRMARRTILQIGLSSGFIMSVAVLLVVLSHGPLFALVISLFLFNASNGIIGPMCFTLAIESQGHVAGSASALLGILPFLLGSITSPLVGMAGEFSALPFGVIIFTTTVCCVVVYVSLVKKAEPLTSSTRAKAL